MSVSVPCHKLQGFWLGSVAEASGMEATSNSWHLSALGTVLVMKQYTPVGAAMYLKNTRPTCYSSATLAYEFKN